MPILPPVEDLVARIHKAPGRIVLAISGGGAGAIGALTTVAGASRTLLEAAVPYSEEAISAWLGGRPDAFCASPTARAMAMAAYLRAVQRATGRQRSTTPPEPLLGIAATAALATDRPRRGSHRIHLAWQSAAATTAWSLELVKGHRSRGEEERLAERLVLNLTADALGLSERLDPCLAAGEYLEQASVAAPTAWQELLAGHRSAVAHPALPESEAGPPALLPGAFHPLHVGHRRMAETAGRLLHRKVAFEISIENVDKPPLDFLEIRRRLEQFGEATVWLTRAASFAAKAELFPGATFVVGIDTFKRIIDPRYYGGDAAARRTRLAQIAERDCRFLVFGRVLEGSFRRLEDVTVPEPLRGRCRAVDEATFREDVSSTALRRRSPER